MLKIGEMELKVKLLRWSAGIPVAMLNEETANIIGVKTKGRVFIKTFNKNPKGIIRLFRKNKRCSGTYINSNKNKSFR